MTEYGLYDSVIEKRLIISDEPVRDANQTGGTYAETWLDAKERLGFELTGEQKRLRQKQIEEADRRVAA